jgi:hypothetical protein
MRRFSQPQFVLALLLGAVGCASVDPTGGLPAGEAQLALINALPAGTIATLLLDDAQLPLPPTGTRISRVIAPGSHRLEARATGGRTMASASFALAEGSRRTAIIGGSAMGPAVTVIVGADTASLPTGDAAKIRVVHTVAGTPTLEAWLTPQGAIFDNAARLVSPFDYGVGMTGEFPGYVVRSPGTYKVRVTNLATGATQAELLVSIEAGHVWSVILTRRADGELDLLAVQEH